jgi:beta-galactosidase
MPDRFAPINPKCPHMLHGGDYNPDQWKRTPEIWDQDMRLMKLAGCNAMTVGIFSWTQLEPDEGKFDFSWLDTMMDKLSASNAFAVLATPSGAKPAWMAQKYPEVLRTTDDRKKLLWGGRHNHCFTSPVYREKVSIINTRLAERYKDHPALLLWHISNEYGGDCHCDLCQNAFRAWLKQRYNNDLDLLNQSWWTAFWSHTYTDWSQIVSPSRIGERGVHGHNIDWMRFITDQTIDFYRHEIAPLKRITPDIPCTTNLMGFYTGLDYWKFAQALDVVSWDSYPAYHDRPDDWNGAVTVSFIHNMNRSFKGGKPWMQMECSPSVQNWKAVNKLKRPGLHIVEGLQSIACGSDTVQYFQWRKSRGGCEKFHGAVVDHCGEESVNTRVFKEVAQLGKILSGLDDVVGMTTKAQVAILYDWENRWAIDDTAGPRNQKKEYDYTCVEHYRPFWSAGVPCDVVNEDSDFSGYKLLIAPMLYMVRPGVAEKIEKFVAAGGTFVATYLSGIADATDLCFLTGFPGPLRKVLGVWAEEIDALYDEEKVAVVPAKGNKVGLAGRYTAGLFCDVIHAETAKVLATYGSEFYQGTPALTANSFGRGQAYYMASRNDRTFHTDFYNGLIDQLGLRRALGTNLPDGVTAHVRTDGQKEVIFLLGFNREAVKVDLGKSTYKDRVTGGTVTGKFTLPKYTAMILEPAAARRSPKVTKGKKRPVAAANR